MENHGVSRVKIMGFLGLKSWDHGKSWDFYNHHPISLELKRNLANFRRSSWDDWPIQPSHHQSLLAATTPQMDPTGSWLVVCLKPSENDGIRSSVGMIFHSQLKKYFTSCDPHHDIYTFSYWQIFWHSIWHIFWHSIWHSIWHIFCHIFWHSIWQIFWHSIWHIFWHSIWHIFWHIFWHSIWHIFWHSIWQIFWHSIWHIFWHSIWHIFWQIFWHSIWHIFWHSIWHIFWHSIWHIFWHSIWHSIWHIFWHSIWHIFWHSFWHIFWPLSGISSDILSGILSGSIWHIFWHIIWQIFWDSIWHILWHSIWHFIWHSIWHTFWHSIWHFVWHSIWHSIWHIFWHSIWHIFWHSFWHIFCTFFVPYLPTWGPAGNTWRGYSRLRSGREHGAWMVVVEVRQGTLGGDGRGWGPAGTLGVDGRGWGPAGNTGRGWSWLRPGREHWAGMVVVEVRQGTLGMDGRGWGPAGSRRRRRGEEDEEERRRRRRRRTRQEEATDIKSNNPHLAGGKSHKIRVPNHQPGRCMMVYGIGLPTLLTHLTAEMGGSTKFFSETKAVIWGWVATYISYSEMNVHLKHISNWWLNPAPLKNMSSSVGIIIPYYGKS